MSSRMCDALQTTVIRLERSDRGWEVKVVPTNVSVVDATFREGARANAYAADLARRFGWAIMAGGETPSLRDKFRAEL